MTATANSPVIGRGWFIAIMAVTLVLGWLFLRRAYDNPVATVLVLWALSFGMANVWAKLYYHRWVFSPSDQYPSFWRGDLLWLPLLMAVPLCLLLRHVPDRDRPYWFESWWWPVIAAGIGIAFAGWFWWTQRAVFPCGALYSGPKLWHDLVVYPLFTYFLVSALPALWYSDWGLAPWFRGHPQWVSLLVLAPLLGAGLWVYDGLVSDRHYDAVADAVRIQSWTTGEVSGPLRLIPTTPCSIS